MQVCTSLQTDNHASTPPLCFLQAGCPSCRPTNSVKALKAQRIKKIHYFTLTCYERFLSRFKRFFLLFFCDVVHESMLCLCVQARARAGRTDRRTSRRWCADVTPPSRDQIVHSSHATHSALRATPPPCLVFKSAPSSRRASESRCLPRSVSVARYDTICVS